MARRNTPEIRTGCLYYKPSMNKTDIVPNYFLHETAAWLVFPHELEGLSHEEMQKKWDPAISTVRTNPTRIEFQPSAWFPPPAIVPTATTHSRLLVVWERSVAVGSLLSVRCRGMCAPHWSERPVLDVVVTRCLPLRICRWRTWESSTRRRTRWSVRFPGADNDCDNDNNIFSSLTRPPFTALTAGSW